MKLNKKGFMMAEVVVVSAVVLIFLASVYVSYNSLYSKYKSRITYYDAVLLYQLAYYRDVLIDNKQITNALEDTKAAGIKKINGNYNINTDNNIFMMYNNKNNLTGNELDGIDNIHLTYKEYINYLSTSVDLTDSNYVMTMEKCNNDGDDCKYAYLEVYDGNENN